MKPYSGAVTVSREISFHTFKNAGAQWSGPFAVPLSICFAHRPFHPARARSVLELRLCGSSLQIPKGDRPALDRRGSPFPSRGSPPHGCHKQAEEGIRSSPAHSPQAARSSFARKSHRCLCCRCALRCSAGSRVHRARRTPPQDANENALNSGALFQFSSSGCVALPTRQLHDDSRKNADSSHSTPAHKSVKVTIVDCDERLRLNAFVNPPGRGTLYSEVKVDKSLSRDASSGVLRRLLRGFGAVYRGAGLGRSVASWICLSDRRLGPKWLKSMPHG